MPVKTNTENTSWVRVRLATPADGELVLRADRLAIDDEHVVFLCANETVFRLERVYFRAATWFVERPSLAERDAKEDA